ncbi:hypothetical protein MVEG_02727 [Podila verticillata NRRL 6337]|nr:hypothetical protein MVEG_02727 [Podila verticillata NRRL 6337]
MESSSSSSSHHRGQATPGTSSGRGNHNHNHTHTHTHTHSNTNHNNNTHNQPSQSHPYQYQAYQPSQAHFSRNSQHDPMFDRDDDDQSDGSEGEGDPGFEEIEYWLQRCSICFDSRLDFCLEYCRDQFCRDCFQRYVKEVVSNSWGLNVTKIKCPVCQDTIPLAEWSKYVDQATRDQYQLYNQPYRSFSRFCNECDEEVFISQVKKTLVGASAKDMLPSFESLFVTLKSIISLGGFSHEDSTHARSTSHKSTSHFGKKNAVAQALVKKFSDDYQSLCTAPPVGQSRLPLMAHSYLSSLSFRSLVNPPEQQSQPQQYQPPSLPHTHQRPPVPSVVIPPPSLPLTGASVAQPSLPRGNTPTQPTGTAMQRSTPLFQKRQGPAGVLEIYQTLMTSLLELFDLQDDEGTRVKEGRVKEPGFEAPDSNGGDTPSQAVSTSSRSTSLVEPTGSKSTLKRARTATHKVMTRNQSKRENEIKKKIVTFSKELSSLETRPDQWKELQFLHVRWLRWDWCHKCQLEICLQCGQSTHHENQDCFGYMRSLIAGEARTPDSRRKRMKAELKTSTTIKAISRSKGKSRSDQETTTLQWKLQNTNPCPNCCILIHRDDGCNKVDCMLCGYRFCWVCREAWGVDCGFYKCGRQTEDSSLEYSLEKKKEEGHVSRAHGNEAQEEQVESLGISTTASAGPETNPSRPDHHGTRSEESPSSLATPTLSDKPEIGVPNVFVIQQKRARF